MKFNQPMQTVTLNIVYLTANINYQAHFKTPLNLIEFILAYKTLNSC